MGRVGLKIERFESANERQATYAKRKHGVTRKAYELSILVDIDMILLMFSPNGRPCLCTGKHSIEEVIAQFAQVTPQERAKGKLESLEALKTTFKKKGHDVNIQDFLGTSTRTIEELTNQARLLQTQLAKIRQRRSFWYNPNEITNLEHLRQMEVSVRDSLNQIRTHKEMFQKQQVISLGCTNQFQNEMKIPFRMGVKQQLQSMPWIPNNESKHLVFPEEAKMLPPRDMECSVSSSFRSCSGHFSSGKNSEIANSGQENGILNSLSTNASLRLQLGAQYPYNLDIDPNFEAPGAGFGATQQSSDSASDPSEVSIFEECSYPPQSN